MSFKIVCELLDKLTPEEKEILIEKLTIPKEHKCQFIISADWTHLTCKCGNKISPLGDGKRVFRNNGLLTIDGIRCTFDTKEIRSEIGEISKVYSEFCLPEKYSCVKIKGQSGFVMKIIEK